MESPTEAKEGRGNPKEGKGLERGNLHVDPTAEWEVDVQLSRVFIPTIL